MLTYSGTILSSFAIMRVFFRTGNLDKYINTIKRIGNQVFGMLLDFKIAGLAFYLCVQEIL